ncbi:MAG: LamG-like jellyroll fold domain-containing protein [Verrucomicrobiota bacterium]
MKIPHCFLLILLIITALCRPVVRADIASDYAAITGTTAGRQVSGWGNHGIAACLDASSFPVIKSSTGLSIMVAGRYNDSQAATAARAVAMTGAGMINGGGDFMPALLEAGAKWASRKSTPSTITVGCGPGIVSAFWSGRGYSVKSVTTTMDSAATDLSGVDVFVIYWHQAYTPSAVAKIQAFTAAGGGLVCGATPWSLGAEQLADSNNILAKFGIAWGGYGWDGPSPFTVSATAPSPYCSAASATRDLIRDKEGLMTMSAADKGTAAAAIAQAVDLAPGLAWLKAELDTLSDSAHYGLISPTFGAPLVKADKPVEATLASYQYKKFDSIPAGELFAHPTATDWPGGVAPGGTVTKTMPVNGDVPVDFYMNNGGSGRNIETRLYAAPGAVVTVTIPADKTAAGLNVVIGCHYDSVFHLGTWVRFPQILRRVPLTQAVTQTGNVFGGLITFNIPAGLTLGDFEVTISGAVEAPCFQLGVDTDESWNATLKKHPGAWGCIMTENVPAYGNTSAFVGYVSRKALQGVISAEKVARHWQTVMETADHYMGYEGFRKRGESLATDRQLTAGAGIAGYPARMYYADSDVIVNSFVKGGDWGFYHELGHGYQNDFDRLYTIATSSEVDVNLVPGILYTLVHKRNPWDGEISSFYTAVYRIASRNAYLALPAGQQTWGAACSTNGGTAYDFYNNLAEAFGWDVYRTALHRLMVYLQDPEGSTDTDLKNISTSDPNWLRDRFYILFCDASGRNLNAYFQRYGLGVAGKGYEITQSAKDLITSRGYPVWDGNLPMTAISNPGTVTMTEDAAAGTLIHTFSVTDPDPGEIHTYAITAGDPGEAFALDRFTGELRVRALDLEKASAYSLTVTAYGNGVPFSGTRPSISRAFTVNVTNVSEVPVMTPRNFAARSTMSAGTVLGSITTAPESGRTIASYTILSGNTGGIFAINATTGALSVQLPASLPNPGTVVLSVRATDSAGVSGYVRIQIFCNTSTGLANQHWKLDETSGTVAASAVGGLAGTFQDSPTLGQTGATASTATGINLGGMNDFVKVPSLGITSNTFTISGWIRRDGDQPAYAGIIYSRPNGAGCALMYGPGNELRYTWNNQYWNYGSGITVPEAKWVFVALVIAPDKATLYLHDGDTLESFVHTMPQTSVSLNAEWQFGQDGADPGRNAKMGLDDVRMYYRSLSAVEVQQLRDESAATLGGVITDQHWRLDEATGTVAVNSAGGLSGAYEGSPLLFQEGVTTETYKGVRLDGVNDHVKVPALGITSQDFTVSGWIKRDGSQPAWAGIAVSRAAGAGSGMMFGPNNELRYMWNNNFYNVSTGLTVPDGQWVFVALTVAPNKATLYLHDGATLRSHVNTAAQTNTNLSGDWYFGEDPLINTGRIAKMSMDDMRMYYRSLSAAEIGSIHGDATRPPVTEQHWKLDENAGLLTAVNAAGGLPGAYHGSPALGRTGAAVNTATGAGLDGVDDYVKVPPLGITTNNFTISGWVRRDGNQPVFAGIVSTRAAGTNHGSGLLFGPDNTLRYFWEGNYWSYDSGLTVPEGRWVFVALTIAPDKATLYLQDGGTLLTAVNTAAQAGTSLSGDWQFGKEGATAGRMAKMGLDDVRMYYRTLSAADIRRISDESGERRGVEQHWKLDETTGTVAANAAAGPPGSYLGSPALGQTGAAVNTATGIRLDGVDDYVKVPQLGITSNTFTVSGWIRRDGDQPDWAGILYSRGSGGGSGLLYGPDNELRYSWSNQYWDYSSGLTVPEGQWVFVALVVEPDKATLYMHDGDTLQTSVNTAPQTLTSLSGEWCFGRDTLNAARIAKMGMDDVRMSPRALSATDIHRIYRKSGQTSGVDQYWRLDEVTGTVAATATAGLPGSYQGSPALGQSGAAVNTATGISLDGVDDYVKVPALRITSNTFTVSGWIRRDGDQPDWAGILYSRGSGGGLLYGPDNELRYSWNNQYWDYSSGLAVPEGQWVFVALVVEPDKATLYLDDGDTLQTSVNTAPQTLTSLSGEWCFGRDTLNAARIAKMGLDDVRMYYRSLNQAEIQEIHDRVAPPAPAASFAAISPEEETGVTAGPSGVTGDISEPATEAEVTVFDAQLAITPVPGNQVRITWAATPDAVLQRSATMATGSWADVPGAVSGFETAVSGTEFFRLIKP